MKRKKLITHTALTESRVSTMAEVTSSPHFTVFLFTFFSSSVHSGNIGCRDNRGNPVDWFMVYKLPKLENYSNRLVKQGVGHVYLDPRNQRKWTLLDRGINETDHAVAKTLNQIYRKDLDAETSAYLLYNDRYPKQENYTRQYGHTKGVVAFDRTSGFWMVHSVPGFPPSLKHGSYEYPFSGMKYGQSFLCVSLKYGHFKEIGKQLQYTYPQVYDFRLSRRMALENPAMDNVTKQIHVTTGPRERNYPMTSSEGKRFISFAKSSKFGKDLYQDMVAPYLKSDLLVETWQNPPGKPLPSNCTKGHPKVMNVKELKVLNFVFENSLDHAKWATTMKNALRGNWICIGDINRVDAQMSRGGGTVCAQLDAAANAFRSTVVKREECKSDERL